MPIFADVQAIADGPEHRETHRCELPVEANAQKPADCHEVWEQDKIVHSNDWKISEEVRQFLEEMLEESSGPAIS